MIFDISHDNYIILRELVYEGKYSKASFIPPYANKKIDKNGRVIDLEKNKSKIQTIEKEFRRAEMAEMRILKEEADVRSCVQTEKLNCLEQKRRSERILQFKDDRKMTQEGLLH